MFKPKTARMFAEAVFWTVAFAAFAIKYLLLSPSVLESFLLPMAKHDAAVFAGMSFALGLSGILSSPKGWTGWGVARNLAALFLRTLAVLLLIIYILDILSLYFFSTRLYFTDVAMMKYEMPGGRSILLTLWKVVLKRPAWMIAAFLVCVAGVFATALLLLFKSWVSGRRERIGSGFAFAVFIAIACIPIPMHMSSFIYKPLTENIFERNRELLFPMRYSPEFKRKLLADFKDEPVRAPGRSQRVNVIFVMVESFSAYHSRFFSGLDDFTPNLDRLAAQYTSIPDFFANGWTTQGGLISLMTSAFPIVPEKAEFNELGSPRLKDFLAPDESIAECFNRLGYHTGFYLAGDLTFMGQQAWLQRIGFKEISGDDAPEYNGQLRGAFKSVPDKALYDKALTAIASWPDTSRHFLVLETLWSHRPYHSAVKGEPDDEEHIFRYVDAQIGYLYRNLKEKGYFRNGILIISGDHRAMHPYKKEELDRFGTSATARIPLVIVEESLGLTKKIAGSFCQKDLLPSLEGLVSGEYRHSRFVGNFLSSPPQPPPCIIHARGDERDRVYVKCGSEEAVLELKGDQARYVSGGLKDGKDVIEKIHFERIRK